MNVMDTRATSAMLYLDGVHVSFDGFHAINNLSLTLAPGEMRAIIGPNGAGKTTMMDIITGKTKPDQGTVLFDGIVDRKPRGFGRARLRDQQDGVVDQVGHHLAERTGVALHHQVRRHLLRDDERRALDGWLQRQQIAGDDLCQQKAAPLRAG